MSELTDLERCVLYAADPQKYDPEYIDVRKAAAELSRLRAIAAERDAYRTALEKIARGNPGRPQWLTDAEMAEIARAALERTPSPHQRPRPWLTARKRLTMYTKSDPKWVQAEEVTQDAPGYVTVKAYGETFKTCRVEWSSPYMDKTKSDVLVCNSRGDWLRVWFNDADVKRNP